MATITKKTVRQRDDFKVVIALKDRNDEPLDMTTAQFKFIYKDAFGSSYEVSYDGTTRVNNYTEGEYCVAVFENYNFTLGTLTREEWYRSPDASFSDGFWDYGITRPSDIEITRNGGEKRVQDTVPMPFSVCINETLAVSKGDKGDKGDRGDSGVYVGATPPTDGSVNIAIDPSGDLYEGIPSGGRAGETLVKKSAANYDTAWSSPLRPLFVARGAVWNDTTGFYELNGLTDITETQMIEVYNHTNTGLKSANISDLFSRLPIRTNYPLAGLPVGAFTGISVDARGAFSGGNNIEIANLSPYIAMSNAPYMFCNCIKLKRIFGELNVMNCTSINGMFGGCGVLETVNINKLKLSISFVNSPNLTRDSVLYMINNSANATPITITLHADALARLTAADLALASDKNITIAA